MRAFSPNRLTGSVLSIVVAVALSLLSAGAVFALAATPSGDGTIGKITKTVVKNTGGVYSAQGTVNHFAESGKKFGVFTIDVKDKSVAEVTYFGSYFCFVPSTEIGVTEPEAVTESFSGDGSVDGVEKIKTRVRLPKGHLGCDISVIASVLRPGEGDIQTEIIVKKMVLTATAT